MNGTSSLCDPRWNRHRQVLRGALPHRSGKLEVVEVNLQAAVPETAACFSFCGRRHLEARRWGRRPP